MTMAGQGSDVLPASRDVAVAAARASSDKQADDIVILDVHELIVITDFFVICSAGTQRHDLERLWSDAPRVGWGDGSEAASAG